jgi:hypothetical protein
MKVFIKAAGSARPYEFEFEGKTFGELKAAASAAGHAINWSNTNAIVKSTQVILATEDSVVPQEDNLVLLVVTKKSAAGTVPVTYADLGRNDLLRYTSGVVAEGGDEAKSHFGTFSSKRTDVVIELLDQWFAAQESAPVDVDTLLQYVDDVEDFLEGAQTALGILREKINNGVATEEKFGGFTQAQLDEVHARMSAIVA